jgi:acetyl/propionyl-CoA carboxylase alpha subunit
VSIRTLLIANRGEVAIRIARAAAELGLRTVAVFSEDDARSLHVRRTDEARPLRGVGPAAYLDAEQVVAVALAAGCDAVHPGYGFLSEQAGFARRCDEAGLTFVGPPPEVLQLLGDKLQARGLAERSGVPVVPGTAATSADDAGAFLASLGEGAALVIKAVAGGGGRGMRVVSRLDDVADAWARSASEAHAAFGNGELYVERLVRAARHLEVQIVGDAAGRLIHLGERECSLQRRHQKLIEVAPSPTLPPAIREQLAAAALRLAGAVGYQSLGTFEFLVDAAPSADHEAPFAFLEANPRLQVEHTVTEQVTGIDLVQVQLQLAAGRTLAELGLEQAAVPRPRGFALQARVNLETMAPDGSARPSSGTLSAFEPPSGPGVRVDTFGYAGYTPNPRFDSLLAKVVIHSSSPCYADVVAKASRALAEFRIDGVATNLAFLRSLLAHPEVIANEVHTRFVDEHAAELVARAAESATSDDRQAGSHDAPTVAVAGPAHTVPIVAAMPATVVAVEVHEGDVVYAGQQLAVVEAMKMEHLVAASTSGIVRQVAVKRGDTLVEGQPLLFIEPTDDEVALPESLAEVDLDAVRADLAEVRARHAMGLDEERPDAVARRRKTGQRTARENVADLCDPDTFIEYGALALAAQRRRHSFEKLLQMSPADGLVAGLGAVNGRLFDAERARCMVMAYDYTVLAGTQGAFNHKKKDRLLQLAERWRVPLVIFAEGGGGRPGDSDAPGVAGLDTMTFVEFAKLSGLVPLVGVVSGRCFAGNAALLGCCDVIIAAEDSNVGMGGPAMIEGGGLGVFAPEEVGPIAVQVPNGVVDVLVADEAEGVRVAKQYLSYFQGPVREWQCGDQRRLRHLVPENRLRVYDVHAVIEAIADSGSVLELRRGFGVGIITALVRIEGQPFGVIANNPLHLGGAIDADAADKAARFLQLCDAFDLPIVSLCDTPGFMVGPEAEKSALVRHVSRMFVVGASVTVPFFTLVLRKGYGLGAQAMAGGSFHAPVFIVAWPSGEFGGMGLEGAVRLGFRKELAAISDPDERQAVFQKMVAAAYEQGKAINMASFLEIDDVIDPAESRQWIMRGLRSMPPAPPRSGKKRPCVDAW